MQGHWLMAHQLEANPTLHSPGYWDGYDIQQDEVFYAQEEFLILNKRQYTLASLALKEGLAAIASGNSTEVRYQNTEFNPPAEVLPDGSVIVLESESLAAFRFDDQAIQSNEGEDVVTQPIPIARPFADHWLAHQGSVDEQGEPVLFGIESVFFINEKIWYSRILAWGVIVSLEKERRAVQTFNFHDPVITSWGIDGIPDYRRRGPKTLALPMPISIGETTPSLHIRKPDGDVGAIRRMRSIDVVYPAAGNPERTKRSLKRVPKLSLAHQAT